jgi:hypothetical protein
MNRHRFIFANLALLVVFVAIIAVPGCTASIPQPGQVITVTVVDKTILYSNGYSHYVFTDGKTVFDTDWLNWRQLELGKTYQFEYNNRIPGYTLMKGGNP